MKKDKYPRKTRFLITVLLIVVLLFIFEFRTSTYYKPINVNPSPTPSLIKGRQSLYISGSWVGKYDFQLMYPDGWKVYLNEYPGEKNYSDKILNRLSFELIPPDILSKYGENVLWGGFSVDVYPAEPSAEAWFTDWLNRPDLPSEGYTIPRRKEYFNITNKKIGNMDGYWIETSSQGSILKNVFTPRFIVLGKKYSYELFYFGSGMDGFSNRVEKEILRGLYFK